MVVRVIQKRSKTSSVNSVGKFEAADEMSEKKLKQMRLPFAIIPTGSSSPSTPKTPVEKTTPVASRKRKPSNDGDNLRSNKIGRVTDSKENIAAQQDVLEISDSDEEMDEEMCEEEPPKIAETTPTTTVAAESVLHIKLSSAKSKRKINMELKPPKHADDEDAEDSVVYLDEDEIRKSSKKAKKSAKKSEKKKRKKDSKPEAVGRVKKTLTLEEPIEETPEAAEEVIEESPEIEAEVETESNKNDKAVNDQAEAVPEIEEPTATDEDKAAAIKRNSSAERFQIVPSSKAKSDPEDAINDELIEMLSDDSNSSAKDTTSPPNDDNKTPKSAKFDITKLTPKQLARRQEQEARRLEKELLRQKERDLKEQQRLKEKEARDEAKRKEREEKEEARRKEKEDRDRKKQAEQEKKDEEKRVKEEERKVRQSFGIPI